MRIRRVATASFPPVKPAAAGGRRRPAGRATTRRRTASGDLTGRRLAAAAHPVAMQADPTREGLGPRELQEALVAAGVAIGGGDAYMALYVALNSPSGHFERAGRGRYRWLPVAEG
jgi:hypothetical protein